MLKQGLQQKMQQRLSPLQIQTIKLLELPSIELEQRIKKEIEENPVLDDGPAESNNDGDSQDDAAEEEKPKQVSLSDYGSDDTPSYKLYVNNRGKDEKPQYNTFSVKESFQQSLVQQLGYRHMHSPILSRFVRNFILSFWTILSLISARYWLTMEFSFPI